MGNYPHRVAPIPCACLSQSCSPMCCGGHDVLLGSYGLGAAELAAPEESRRQGHWHLVPWCGCVLSKALALGRTHVCLFI